MANLVETMCLSRYPIPTEITYDQVSDFIGHNFRKPLIEMEYGIVSKPSNLGNFTSNKLLEWINQVILNLVQTCNINQNYVDEDDPWYGILAAAEFVIISTTNRLKGYIPGKLVFGRDMILLIKHKVNWEIIRQKNQTKINKDNILKNTIRADHGYRVGDKFMLNNYIAYKYAMPYKGTFVITQFSTNGTLNLQCGEIKIKYKIRCIKIYKSDTNVEDINPKNMSDDVNI